MFNHSMLYSMFDGIIFGIRLQDGPTRWAYLDGIR